MTIQLLSTNKTQSILILDNQHYLIEYRPADIAPNGGYTYGIYKLIGKEYVLAGFTEASSLHEAEYKFIKTIE